MISKTIPNKLGRILIICLGVFSVSTVASAINVYSMGPGLLDAFVVEGHFIDSTKMHEVVVSNARDDLEGSVPNDENIGTSALKESFINNLSITYQNQQIISPELLPPYDYIRFLKVCKSPTQRDRLLFHLVLGGSANGEIADILFVYYDSATATFKSQIIEERYLEPICNLEGAAENKRQEREKIAALKLIYEQMDPLGGEPDFEKLIKTGESLPTRQLSHLTLERLLEEARRLVPEVKPLDSKQGCESEEEDEDYFESQVVFNVIAENDRWKVVEFMYLQLWSSWGVLLVQDKSTEQWTSFYTSAAGDSNSLLYLDTDVELIADSLRGRFELYAKKRVEISLNDFTVHKTHPYSFSDYSVDAYHGPIAKLKTKSSEFASTFQTLIKRQLKEGVNFAGRYSVMRAGCGAQCQIVAITDVMTGEVVAELNGRAGAEFKAGSELFALDTNEFCIHISSCKPKYYRMINGKMVLLDEH